LIESGWESPASGLCVVVSVMAGRRAYRPTSEPDELEQ
jgi:hypothetical protein